MKTPQNTQVVVLMGGLGTRLKELTAECPKPLIPVQGKPFFEYQLRLLTNTGFRKFLFCVGYRGEMIETFFGDGSKYGITIKYSYDGKDLLGTGGALQNALSLLDDDFMLLYGDSFMDIDYEEVLYRYWLGKKKGQRALLTILQNNGRFDRSNVCCVDGKIELYDKKTPSSSMDYIDYGVSMFERLLFERYNFELKFDLSEIQNKLSRKGELACCEVANRFFEIGSPTSLEEFSAYAEKRWKTPNNAVFLDRDGVINAIVFNEDTEQLDSPLCREQFQLLPGVVDALRLLREKSFLIFIVTNQPAAAKGKTTLGNLYDINLSFIKDMQRLGIIIQDIIICPHYERATSQTKENFLIKNCDCRKPKPGMMLKILQKYNIAKDRSFMVGDSFTDILAGRRAGIRTVLIGSLKCDFCKMLDYGKPDMIRSSLLDFAEQI